MAKKQNQFEEFVPKYSNFDDSDEAIKREQQFDMDTQLAYRTDTEEGMAKYIAGMDKRKPVNTSSSTENVDAEEAYNIAKDAATSVDRENYSGEGNKAKRPSTMNEMFDEYLNSKYYENAVINARNLANDVLGQYSSRTGGMGNSYAVQAAANAGTNSMLDVQNQLWDMARKDKNDQTDKYTQMIDYMLENGATPDEIPAEFYAMSGYDRGYADFIASNKANQKSEAEAKETIMNMLSSGKTPSEDLIKRSGWSQEYINSLPTGSTTLNDVSEYDKDWSTESTRLENLFKKDIEKLEGSVPAHELQNAAEPIITNYINGLIKLCNSLSGKYSDESINKLLESKLNELEKIGIDTSEYFE